MPRRERVDKQVCHVYNRAAAKLRIFDSAHDYRAFLALLLQTKTSVGALRIHGYCLMPNHWHLIICAETTRHLWRFVHRVCTLHARAYLAAHPERSGAVYQGRYKCLPVQAGEHLRTLLRYVDRNPLKARLVERVEDWLWSSALHHAGIENDPLVENPPGLPDPDWMRVANNPQAEEELIRVALATGRPIGDMAWVRGLSRELQKQRGRPGKLSRVQLNVGDAARPLLDAAD